MLLVTPIHATNRMYAHTHKKEEKKKKKEFHPFPPLLKNEVRMGQYYQYTQDTHFRLPRKQEKDEGK